MLPFKVIVENLIFGLADSLKINLCGNSHVIYN